MKDLQIQIKVYNGKERLSAVYVLSRGKNSGKPLKKPCPNCYVIQVPPTKTLRARAVAQILFESGRLGPYFRGSVIEYVSVADYRSLFLGLWFNLSEEKLSKVTQVLTQIEINGANIQHQLELLNQLRHATVLSALM